MMSALGILFVSYSQVKEKNQNWEKIPLETGWSTPAFSLNYAKVLNVALDDFLDDRKSAECFSLGFSVLDGGQIEIEFAYQPERSQNDGVTSYRRAEFKAECGYPVNYLFSVDGKLLSKSTPRDAQQP